MNEELLHKLWLFLPKGYLFTTCIETPVLLLGLSPPHSWKRRLAAGIWLNACSYPIVVIALPILLGIDSPAYLPVAETFAPLSECALFSLAFHNAQTPRAVRIRDWVTIIAANLVSFIFGLWATNQEWYKITVQ